ncbi:hypothetical protein [Actinomadura nitritigenes]|uniref:hypothetical protein n=1 Tax=Actinomadura nitritigenes TaxID=134602 RepID=UPI003D8C09C3
MSDHDEDASTVRTSCSANTTSRAVRRRITAVLAAAASFGAITAAIGGRDVMGTTDADAVLMLPVCPPAVSAAAAGYGGEQACDALTTWQQPVVRSPRTPSTPTPVHGGLHAAPQGPAQESERAVVFPASTTDQSSPFRHSTPPGLPDILAVFRRLLITITVLALLVLGTALLLSARLRRTLLRLGTVMAVSAVVLSTIARMVHDIVLAHVP